MEATRNMFPTWSHTSSSSTHQKKLRLEVVSNKKLIGFKGNKTLLLKEIKSQAISVACLPSINQSTSAPQILDAPMFSCRKIKNSTQKEDPTSTFGLDLSGPFFPSLTCHAPSLKRERGILGASRPSHFKKMVHGNPILFLNDGRGLSRAHAHKLKTLKRELPKMEDGFQALLMIDDIQRLGVDHHFQKEIEAILVEQYELQLSHFNGKIWDYDPDASLHKTALRFRLLRQQGFPIRAEIFGKFMDEEVKIKYNSRCDIKGLMALYEASQLSTRGEDLLEEARKYSYEVLSSSIRQVGKGQSTLLREMLKNPQHKSLAKFNSRKFLNNYLPGESWWGRDLKGLANLEFEMVQAQHKQEIIEISRWWKSIGLSKELNFARDQPLKWYTSTATCLSDPRLSEERIHLTKPISFIYLIDDIFDVYAQPRDLVLFTDVVNRWDMSAADNLPDEMKICFKALHKITNEISHWVYEKHGWDPTESLHKAWADLCNAFLVESNWLGSGNLPNWEVYLKNGIVSSGVHVVLVHIFFLLGQGITKQNVELIENNPGIISAPAAILRLWDDLGSAKDENQNGYDGSFVECYINEHRGTSIEEAREFVTYLISESWKQLNEECLCPNPYSLAFRNAALNLARTVPLMYNYDSKHRLSNLEEFIHSLLNGNMSY